MAVADVHKALKALSPTNHAEFPSNSSDLNEQLASSVTDAHTLVASLPLPTVVPDSVALPEPADQQTQKEWKPVKLSAKENPLGISVFRLSANDGKGTWFARRSVHTDIPFQRFRAGLQQEFQQPKKEGDAPGSSSVRGIGKDARLHYEVSEHGTAEIFQLSAQFPGPSAPREFVEGCLSTSAYPDDLSAATSWSGVSNIEFDRVREVSTIDRLGQFMMISKPVLNHPECEERRGYVRGAYESVEFIREIPFTPKRNERSHSTPNVLLSDSSQTVGRRRGKTVGTNSREPAKTHPVEWIMITRSDPGGSVPKWMVERGTPGGIVKDAAKFLNWCRDVADLEHLDPAAGDGDEIDSSDEGFVDHGHDVPEWRDFTRSQSTAHMVPSEEIPDTNVIARTNESGLFASASGSVTAGTTSLAQSVTPSSNATPPPSSPPDALTPSPPAYTPYGDQESDSELSSTASLGTFETCESAFNTAPLSHTTSESSITNSSKSDTKTPEERALALFLTQKQKLEEDLQKEEHRRTEREKKLIEKNRKQMEKQERKFRRAVEKTREKKRKEDAKKEREIRRKLEKDYKGGRKEIAELKNIVEGLTKENLQLREELEQGAKVPDKAVTS
jgi:hypothetical protein